MDEAESSKNGSVAAALISAGAGAAACGVLYVLGGVTSLRDYLTLYVPSGTLSGVSTGAIVIWLVTWVLLSRLWAEKTVDLRRTGLLAMGLVLAGVFLTFPPVARLF